MTDQTAGLPEDHSSLASYQWGVAKIEQQTRFVKRLWTILGSILVAGLLMTIIWSVVSFSGQVETIRHQQVAFHADTIDRDAAIQCETQTLNQILTELALSQAAMAKHQTPPVFVFPKPC
jgi:hypothetical protein